MRLGLLAPLVLLARLVLPARLVPLVSPAWPSSPRPTRTTSGSKQFTTDCPAATHGDLSGGFNDPGIRDGERIRSNASGNPTGTNAWTIIQTSRLVPLGDGLRLLHGRG